LLKTNYMLLCAVEHPHPMFLAIHSESDVKMSSFSSSCRITIWL